MICLLLSLCLSRGFGLVVGSTQGVFATLILTLLRALLAGAQRLNPTFVYSRQDQEGYLNLTQLCRREQEEVSS